MSKLTDAYKWLYNEKHPAILLEALKYYGTIEFMGDKNNPTIINWAKEVGGKTSDVYKADSIPWCGLFIGYVTKKAGLDRPNNCLWALSWSAWGTPQDTAMLGDVLVFTRNGGGHVGIYVGEDENFYHVLGGNQSDSVNIARIAKNRVYAIRRTKWKIAQPDNVRQVVLSSTGTLVSTNEA